MKLQVLTGNAVGDPQVPVVMLDGEVMVDSSAIISRLAAEKDAEAAQAAAGRPKAKRGWFSRAANDSGNQARSTSHTGLLLRAQPASSSDTFFLLAC